MKKMYLALICACLLLGLGGCGSKQLTDPKDIYEKLKEEGIKVNMKYNDFAGESYTITMSINGYEIQYSINDISDFKDFNYTNMKNKYQILGFQNEDKKLTQIAYVNTCMTPLTDGKAKDADCGEADLSDLNDMLKDIDGIHEKLNVDDQGLLDFFAWYIEQQGESAKQAFKK